MRAGGAPAAALLLAFITLITPALQTAAEDLYWEGEEDASNEFLEVKEPDTGIAGHIHRLKRGLWDFWDSSPTTTEKVELATEDDSLFGEGSDDKDDEIDTDGSGLSDREREPEQREKTLRVTFVVGEPYRSEYSNRDSVQFQTFSRSLADAVNLLYDSLPGTQRASLVRIQSRISDEFSCKVTLDIVTAGYEDTNKITDILRDHIRTKRTLGVTPVSDADFSATVIDPGYISEFEECPAGELQCNDGRCVPQNARCNGNQECADGSDEAGCPASPAEPEQREFSTAIPETTPVPTLPPPEPTDWLPWIPQTEDQRREDVDDRENEIEPTPSYQYPERSDTCLDYELRCDETRCVAKDKQCDGTPDCDDGTDERDCPESCGERDFRCLDGKCIEEHRRCNGIVDCPSREDEQDCQCRADEFRCVSDGSCIESRKHCDGVSHCLDNSDEDDCACGTDQWQCDHGNCIKRTKRCNGRVDCPTDRSDERNCFANGYFRCRQGKMIPLSKRCNRRYDCGHGDYSDEQNCPCGEHDFKCDNDYCIPASKHCDRTRDCQDGSDERGCTYGKTCMASQYKCSSGQCVQADALCNGTAECADGSDERNCPCKRDQFRCRDGTCISNGLRCNGRQDCHPGGEDELNCGIARCPPDSFTCDPSGSVLCAKHCDGRVECDGGEDEDNCESCNHICDGKCLDDALICNGKEDCSDGSDEVQCDNCDQIGDFRCRDGQCIKANQQCNGVPECSDYSDEQDCNKTMISEPHGCSDNEYQCREGTCIDIQFFCDGNPDCIDRSDEENCPCGEDEWQCLSGLCIPRTAYCDGRVNCPDGTDESNCQTRAWPTTTYRPERPPYVPPPTTTSRPYPQYPSTSPPFYNPYQPPQSGSQDNSRPIYNPYQPPQSGSQDNAPPIYNPYQPPQSGSQDRNVCDRNQWRCENGPCIHFSQRCDGRIDCPLDSSDEFDCPAGSPAALDLKTYPEAQVIRNGGDVVFQCRDEGPLRAAVRWFREGGRPLKPGSTDRNGRLEMNKVTLSDSGTYICQAVGYSQNSRSEVRVQLNIQDTGRNDPRTERPQFKVCQSYEATCANGQCIKKSALCDGVRDCADGSDEESCDTNGKCEPNEFQCRNRKCVLKTWLCDSEDDCDDGSDEQNCGQPEPGQCLPVEFKCHSGTQCVPKSFHCDGQSDCIDGSDEIGCAPVHVTRPPSPAHLILNIGDTLNLVCEAVGVPTPLISWRLNWGHVPQQCTSTSNNGIGSLTCTNMKPEHSGAYSCEAINNKGTTFAAPDSIVYVNRTNICPTGYFNSEAQSARECIRCFCFGESTECHSADLFTYNMPTPLGEGGTRLVGVKQEYTGEIVLDTQPITDQYYYQPLRNGATVTKLANYGSNWYESSNAHPYLTLPETYNGNQLTSYGGHIKYRLSPHSLRYESEDRFPNIIIKGKYGTLVNRNNGDGSLNIEARLTPENWMKASSSGSVPATREDLMMALDNVEKILLRADLNNAGVNITDFVMESAQLIDVGLGAANLVEECICPPGYEGLSCQKCSAGYIREKSGPWLGNCVREPPAPCPLGTYGDPGSGYGCRPCPCPLTNPENQFARTCSISPSGSVRCDCLPGYGGQNCEYCEPGFVGNPMIPGDSCKRRPTSNCNPVGTLRSTLPDECQCKENVQGRYCDQCKNDSFYLSDDFRNGCALCFCSGVTQQCTSSSLRRKTTTVRFNTPQIVDQVKLYNSAPLGPAGAVKYNAPVETDLRPQLIRGEIAFTDVDRSRPTIYYWSLPPSFSGDKVTSYGGFLRYTLRHVPTNDISRNNAPDVQLVSDNRLTFHYFGNSAPSSDGIINASIQFIEKGWQRPDGKEISREHFLLALADVKAVLVKASYSTNSQLASIDSASIDTAESNGDGPQALHVEQCVCPVGYVGSSCEDCAPGYTRSSSGLYLVHCEPCNCNGHSNMCHPEDGVCYNCQDNTDGDNCEICKPGYEKNAYGMCVRSSYYETTPGALICRCDPRGEEGPCTESGYCQCKQNVEGEECDRCRQGTFGLDGSNPVGCISCYCSGVTNDCHEASHYVRIPIAAPIFGDSYGGYTLTDLNAEQVINDQFVPAPNESELMYMFSSTPYEELYWSLPVFPGNRVLSYGGTLSLTQKFNSGGYPEVSSPGTDVVLVGESESIYWRNPTPIRSGEALSYQVPLREDDWFILNSANPVTRDNFMSVLKNLKRVLVRATLASNILSTAIADVSMDTATTDRYSSELPAAKGVEICMCPEGYTGTSCESCAPQWYKDRYGACKQCNCNGHDCQLGSYDEVICNCLPPYSGPDCSTVGGESSTSDTTTYRPSEPTVIVRITSPTIKIQEVGSSVNFSCQAQSLMTSIRLPVDWVKAGGNLPQGRSYVDGNTGTLLITNVQPSDSGKYICQTSDGISTAQAIATLRVPGNDMTIPTVTISPAINDYYEGDRIQLECITSGNPAPRISWQRASNRPLPLSSQSVEGLFIIEDARREDSGEYRCIAMNSAGSTERVALLTVRPQPPRPNRDQLSISPSSPTIKEGQSTRLVCTGTTNVPAGSIDWIRQDGTQLEYNVRSDNGVLYVDAAIPENQGVYICQTTLTEVSPVSVTLSVVPLNPPAPGESSDIVVSVDKLKIPTGGSGSVECTPQGYPQPLIKWKKYQGEFGPSTSQRENSLIIANAQDDDQGYYMCEGTVNGSPLDKIIYVYVEIEKREPPSVQIWPQGEQAVALNSQYELHCRVLGGIPDPDITWSRAGGRLLTPNTELQPNNVLRFTRIEVNDEGEYICTATNLVGSDTASAVLKVRSPPEIVITPSNYVQAVNGDSLTVECRANGYPEPLVSIKTSPDLREIVPQSLGIASLRIPKVSERDEGDYLCTATSAAGTIDEQFAVRVERGDGGFGGDNGGSGDIDWNPEYPPQNNNEPSSIIAIEGDNKRIDCNSPEGYSVMWRRNDRPLSNNAVANGASLIIYNVSRSDSGEYECTFINPYDEVQQAAYTTLQVVSAPRITLRPKTQTVHPGQSPTVECIVDGDDIIDITWRPGNRPLSRRVEIRQSTLSSTLIFHQIEVEDAGQYECFARNRYANVSATAEVVVSEETGHETWESHENEQFAHVGAAVHLSCNVTQPNVQIQWTKNGRSVPRSVTQKNDGSLFIKLAQKSDSGHYVCIIQDQYRRNNSNYINLHIEGLECLEMQFRCYDDTGCIEEELLCDGFSDCQDNSDEENCLFRGNRLLDKFSDYDDESTLDGPRDDTTSAALVSIEQPRRAFRVGENVEVLCRASSRDIQVKWERYGTNQFVQTMIFGGGSQLVVQGVQEADAGVYRCSGRDPYGRTSYEDFSLDVTPASTGVGQSVNEKDVVYTARLENIVDLPCNHDLPPPVSIEWRREYSPLSADIRSNEPILHLPKVTEADAGTYICRVSNPRAAVEARAILRVEGIVPSFDGTSWVALPTLKDAYIQFDTEISFKPSDENGLILYNSQYPDRPGDYLALRLVQGVPEFVLDTSSDPVVVRGDRPLQLNKWHTIRISRSKQKVTMDVDNTGPFITESSDLHVLDLTEPLYVGGVPNYVQLPSHLIGTSGFFGCVSMLILGREEKNILMDSIDRYNVKECDSCSPNLCLNNGVCQEARNERGYMCLCSSGFAGLNCDRTGEACRPGLCGPGKCTDTVDGYQCACPITYTGKNCNVKQSIEYPAFTGSAYLAIKVPQAKRFFRMSMKIKATSPVTDGIIMYCAESQRGYGGFTALTVHDGKIEFRYDVGGGIAPVILTADRALPANEWTDVHIARMGHQVSMTINLIHGYNEKLDSRAALNLETPIFVGGVDDSIVLNNNTGVTGGFSGCIKDVMVSGESVNIVNSSIQSANVQECSNYDRGDIPEIDSPCSLCRNGGYCTSAESTACTCPSGFTGLYCENRAPQSARRPPSAYSDPCGAAPCRNGGTCKLDRTARLNYSCDCPLGWAGLNCQISLELFSSVGFNGNGYLEIPASFLHYENLEREPVDIALAVYTTTDGVLLYQREALAQYNYGDYILLRVESGRLVLDWDFGSGTSSLVIDDVYVTDGNRHSIILHISSDNSITLTVDQDHYKTGFTTGISNVMNADSNVYIGGIPDRYNVNRYPGLTGCIEQLELMDTSRALKLGQIAVAGRNTQKCRETRY